MEAVPGSARRGTFLSPRLLPCFCTIPWSEIVKGGLPFPLPPGRRLKDAGPSRRPEGRRCSFGRASFLAPSFERWVCSKLGGWTSWGFSSELPHRPRSGEILREKEWGFSYPHSHGGTKSPPSGGHGFLRRREIGPSVRFRAGGGVRKNTGGESRCGRPVFLECEVVRRRQG